MMKVANSIKPQLKPPVYLQYCIWTIQNAIIILLCCGEWSKPVDQAACTTEYEI